MANNQKKLKAFVRYDGSGRVVASSLILRKNKPRVGRWYEIPEYLCCNGTTNTTTTQGGGGNTPTAFVARIAGGQSEACGNEYGNIAVVYSASATLGIGSYLYYDAELTQPVGGQLWVKVQSESVVYTVLVGEITQVNSCPTLKWRYSSIDSPEEVCVSPGLLSFSFNGSTLCNSTTIYLNTTSIGVTGSVFYGAYEGIARLWVVAGPNQADVWNVNTTCYNVSC
jgi:hypothetical protein